MPFPSLDKTLAAGVVTATGVPATHHDIPLAAEMLIIIDAIINGTL